MDFNLDPLKMKFGKEIDFAITTQEYINIDLDASITHHKLSDQEILAEVTDRRGEESDEEEEIDDNDDSDPVVKPGIEETRKAIEILEKFSVFTRFGEDMNESFKGNQSRCGQGRAMLQKTRCYYLIILRKSDKKNENFCLKIVISNMFFEQDFQN